ncbi:MAG TPA: ATP-grasp fold amidoligase family protein [Syntrophomonadaceae bacterium]|nr:ATP-grasp fold amidoligase family protein [Syntrophomonadaceae bacterium]
MFEKIKKMINNPNLISQWIITWKIFNLLPDKAYLKLKYKIIMGKRLNLENPQTFNEKLQWLKLYDRKPEYTMMVDKYEVRKYIAETIGEEYLIPLLGVWDNFDEIDFENLPEQFVLKCTHNSGSIIICKDKSKLDINKVRKNMNSYLKRNHYWNAREWPYKNVKPRIIAERFMEDESGYELKDYKLMCFNGEPKCLFVCLNRYSSDGLNVDFYDMNWEPMPFERKYKNSGSQLKKPENFNSMIELSRVLSKHHQFLRTDFYEANGRLYLGELTFHPGSGFEEFRPDEWDKKLGDWLLLKETD